MGIAFNFMVLIPLCFGLLAIYSVWNRHYRLTLFLALLMMGSVAFMPVKVTQQNMRVHEDTSKFDNLPPKVEVLTEYYKTYSNQELLKLKQESINEKP